MNGFFSNAAEKLAGVMSYVAEFFGVIVGLFVLAFILEKLAQKKQGVKEKVFTTRKVAMIGMFSAIAMILMLFEFMLPYIPFFYKLDFSEIPILIGSFAFGPVAGVTMELVKILLKLCIKASETACVGEFANFVVGCSFIIPASSIYTFCKTKKSAIFACVLGTVFLICFGTVFNAIYLIPAFSALGMPIEQIYAAAIAVNPLVKDGDIVSFVMACVAPLNLIKGVSVSIVTMLVYKPLSPIIKSGLK